MIKHETIEKNISLMILLIVIVISGGGLAEIVPLFSKRKLPYLLKAYEY